MKSLTYKPHTMPTAAIKVGERHRRDLGDIDALAQNIADIGLLHPIVTDPAGKLIAGFRRLAACTTLGWPDIPVTVIDLDQIVRGEFAENAYRKSLLPTEIYSIWRALDAAKILWQEAQVPRLSCLNR